jgi:hypothetical protein
MEVQIPEIPAAGRVKPTREQALRIAERRKAARRWRNRRLRRAITVFSVAAFIGPFGIIYTQLAAGRDPALSSTQTAAATAAKAPAAAQAQYAVGTTSSTGTSIQTTSPAPVTTQQS